MAKHAGSPELASLRADGRVTEVFRTLLAETAWRPGTETVPAGVACDAGVGWDGGAMGAGFVDAAALLARSLDLPRSRAGGAERLADLPLWASLYPRGTSRERIVDDYRRLFAEGSESELEALARFESEVTHHYAVSEEVSEAIDAIVERGDRSDAALAAAVGELLRRDLSPSLRARLTAPAA
jgi:hypothetical protein